MRNYVILPACNGAMPNGGFGTREPGSNASSPLTRKLLTPLSLGKQNNNFYNSKCLLNTCYMPSTVLSAFHVLALKFYIVSLEV